MDDAYTRFELYIITSIDWAVANLAKPVLDRKKLEESKRWIGKLQVGMFMHLHWLRFDYLFSRV
jgi:hypothetical protein